MAQPSAKAANLKKVAKQIAGKEDLTPDSAKKISQVAQKKMAEAKKPKAKPEVKKKLK